MAAPRDKEPNGVMDRDEQMILSLLTAIEDEPNITQQGLATQLGVAVGLVNSYLKRVIYKGYVKTKQLQRRRLRYLLTPSGIREKSRLTYEFLEYSFRYIRQVRARVHEKLLPYAREGKTGVIFWGSGEVAELAYLAVRELGMELVVVIDPENAGKRCIEHDIQGPEVFQQKPAAQVILLLSASRSPEYEKQLREWAQQLKFEIVSCL
jgi:DNA-binding MarR family transcriptional regulator